MFLAALDQTIVSTALSTISRELDGTTGSLSWVSGAYLLMITALAPCSGKISDYFGRKVVLYTAIVIFIIVSQVESATQHTGGGNECMPLTSLSLHSCRARRFAVPHKT